MCRRPTPKLTAGSATASYSPRVVVDCLFDFAVREGLGLEPRDGRLDGRWSNRKRMVRIPIGEKEWSEGGGKEGFEAIRNVGNL